jgi:RNA polymerase primary sigma factor
MKTQLRYHGGTSSRFYQDLASCVPPDVAEEQKLTLRMRRLRERLVRFLSGLPEPERGRLFGRTIVGPDMPFVQLEGLIVQAGFAARGRRDAGLETGARRAQIVLQVLASERSAFVTRNLRLAFHFAKRFAGRNAPLVDLVQAGNVGLLEAVDRYDPRRGTRFSTYAVKYIMRSVFRTLARLTQPVHIPEYQMRLKSRLGNSRKSLAQELGRAPTVAEMAGRARMREAKARYVLASSVKVLDLDAPMPNSDRNTFADVLADGGTSALESMIVDDLLRELNGVLSTIEPRLVRILRLRYGLEGKRPHTLRQTAVILKLSAERIRQLEEQAVALLRDRMRGLPSCGRAIGVPPAARAAAHRGWSRRNAEAPPG